MRKRLAFINEFFANRDGFIFPYVAFIVVLVLVTITGSINLYRNNIEMTNFNEEQLKIDTLFQMGKSQFKQELLPENLNTSNQYTFFFPHGSVDITVLSYTEKNIYAKYDISTTKQSKYVTFSSIHLE
ncbi:hypothetical protein [Aquibacillus saliphilus]|uniref:hypothetical protein n=1 Tax=Aquibacillus saliphilus TaxID=1909422 RepID=UPI001CEFB38C|nr:hypothetical protein [Aquibacillus saliphilus]